jgi:hypothetical protein
MRSLRKEVISDATGERKKFHKAVGIEKIKMEPVSVEDFLRLMSVDFSLHAPGSSDIPTRPINLA